MGSERTQERSGSSQVWARASRGSGNTWAVSGSIQEWSGSIQRVLGALESGVGASRGSLEAPREVLGVLRGNGVPRAFKGGLKEPRRGLEAARCGHEHPKGPGSTRVVSGSTQGWSGGIQERVREHLGVFRKAQEDLAAPWGSGAPQPSPPR